MGQPVKVVHLTSFHPPGDTRVFHREAKTLAAAGYDVVLVAPAARDAVVDGIRIRAVCPSMVRRDRLTKTIWQVYHAAVDEGAVICHLHDPELLPIGWLLKLRGKHVVYDAHEDLPRQMRNWYFIPRLVRGAACAVAEVIEKVSAWVLDGIVAATPTIAARFPPSRTALVQNFPDLKEMTCPTAPPYAARPAVIAHTGGLSEIRGIREMVAAMDLVAEGLDARLVLAGSDFTPHELGDEVRRMTGWRRCELVSWLDRPGVAAILGGARGGIVIFHPTADHLESYPRKLFEYMAAGLPVVASDFPLWRSLLGEARCAMLVDPKSPKAIAGAIQWLLEHPDEAQAMGGRGREAVRTRFNWDSEGPKLVDLYRKVLGQ